MAIFAVDSASDAVDALPGDGIAEDASGNTTLRAAVMEANASPGDDTINLPAGTYTLGIAGAGEDEAEYGDLDVTDTSGSLRINGAGAATTVIDADDVDRVFDVFSTVSLNLSGTTVTGGYVNGEDGGGIRNQGGVLTLSNCVLDGNRATRLWSAGSGAGLFNSSGDVTIRHSTIQNNVSDTSGGALYHDGVGTVLVIDSLLTANSAVSGGAIANKGYGSDSLLRIVGSVLSDNTATTSAGGGIVTRNGDVELIHTTLSGNTTDNSGGGIACYNNSAGRPVGNVTIIGCTISGNTGSQSGGVENGGPMTIIDSTISGNTSLVSRGGGIIQGGSLRMAGCTITANSSGASGGGVVISGATTIQNTIIAGNSATQSGPDVVDSYSRGTSLGNNLIGNGQSAPIFVDGVNGDQVGAAASPIDPRLGALADNGGTTLTHALLSDSPAVDAGNNDGAPLTDQRGAPRVLDGPDPDAIATRDVGAFEFGYDGFLVNTTDDTVDANPGDGVAEDASGNTSLRAAIMEANALAGDDTIGVGAGVYMLTIAGTGEDACATGDLDVTDNLTLLGVGSVHTAIDADGIDRALEVASGATLDLSGTTITGGSVAGNGGGIDCLGTLSLTEATVRDNAADNGGGIYHSGAGQVTLTRSTLSENTATGSAGGLYSDAAAEINNSTVSGNTAGGQGGGVLLDSGTLLTLASSTLTDNSAASGGGVEHAGSGTVDVNHTIIAGNTATTGGDVRGTFTSSGQNLIGDGSGATGLSDGVNNDQVGTGASPLDAKLGPLADNGGPTLTHALLPGSTAINGGGAGAPATDQRGVARPDGGTADIGAYEFRFGPPIVNFVVTGLADLADPVPGDGVPYTDQGATTLRAAFQEANAQGGSHRITLPAGTYTLDIAGTDEDLAATGDLDVADGVSITIVGAGDATTIIDAGSLGDRVFHVSAGGNLEISGVKITGGTAVGGADGGGIHNAGTLAISRSAVWSNSAEGRGGGIYNAGALDLDECSLASNSAANGGGGIYTGSSMSIRAATFSANTTGGDGGGIRVADGSAVIADTTFSGNLANSGSGGAISLGGGELALAKSTLSGNSANAGGGLAGDGGAVIEIVNTTFSNNTAAAGGGGIWNNGAAASIHHSTLTLNTASSGGGVDNSGSGTVQVKSTIVAANTATSASDVSGAFASAGNNLIGDGTGGAGFTHGVDGNQVGTGASPIDPLLGPLQHNGGPTFTHALLPGSPALDAGSNTDAPPSDQRGALRAVDGPDPDAIATCDVGAYEYVAIGFIVNTTDDTVDADPGDGVAEDASGNTSLRAAIMESNALAGDDTITLGVGPYTLTRDGQNEDEAAVGDLDVTDNLTILGVGGVVHANQIDRAFDVRPGASLDLSGTTVTGGFVSNEDGGGIRNKQGLLTLTNCVLEGNETIRVTFYGGRGAGLFNSSGDVTVRHSTIQNNVAELSGGGIGHEDFGTILVINSLLTANSSSNGGAISNMGQGPNSLLKVVESVISNNSATGNAGGGIANYNGDVELIDSTLSGNTTSLSGGGISCYNNSGGRPVGTVTIIGCTISGNSGSNAGGIDNDGPMTIINSTISGNTSRTYYGGGINQRESLTMAGCTIVANSAGARGGGIAIFGSDTTTTTIRNTIIAGNSAAQSEPDVYDIYSYGDSLGNNLIGDGQGAPSFVNGVNGDQVGSGASPIDPMLGPLMDNGGPTWTHALVPGSPAIDAGGNSGAPSTDQRGFARIADGDEDGTATIDIGAFEFGAIEVGDLALYSVTADGLTTLTLVYQIAVAPADPFQIGFYRSDDSLFQPADELLDSVLISDPADLTAGMHLKTFPIGGGSGEIALPGAGTDETGTDYHLLAVADPDNTIVELDLDPFNEDNTVAFTGVYHVAGGDVFVHGTSDPDTVIVSPGSLRLEVNASVTVYEGADVTGVRVRTHEGADSFDFTYGAGFGSPAAVSLFFQGGAGENNAVLRGSSDAETVTIHPGTAVFQGPGFDVNVTNASGITVHGGGDLDLALIHDDPLAKDTLIGGPDTATLSGNGYSNEVAGFRYVHVYGTTGNGDEALFQGDPNGQDTFEAWPGQAKLRGDDFFLRAKSFGDVRANGTPGGNDIALLHDDPEGIDTFDGGPDRAELSGDAFFLQANSFRYVHAYATDGFGDVATFHDDPARFDKLRAWPGAAKLWGELFFLHARSFGSVYVNSTPGVGDQALLYDSITDDTFTAWPDRAEFSVDTFFTQVNSFRWVHAYSTEGDDVATLYGSDGKDVFVGRDRFGKLRGTDPSTGRDFYNRAVSFGHLHVYGRGAPSRDVATLYDAVLETGTTDPIDMTQVAWLYEFERIRQKSESGETIINATDQIFTAYWQ